MVEADAKLEKRLAAYKAVVYPVCLSTCVCVTVSHSQDQFRHDSSQCILVTNTVFSCNSLDIIDFISCKQ